MTSKPNQILRTIFLGGSLSVFTTVLISAATAFAGYTLAPSQPKIATAEKGAVIMEAVLDQTNLTDESLKTAIQKPILKVIQKYRDLGYVVIDASPDEKGNLSINALPEGALDITAEMRAAVKPKTKTKAP